MLRHLPYNMLLLIALIYSGGQADLMTGRCGDCGNGCHYREMGDKVISEG